VIERASDRTEGICKTAEVGPIEVRIASTELFCGRRDIVILHRGQEYRLHITKADKLILTK
jgi:hemin uptake protein HemP